MPEKWNYISNISWWVPHVTPSFEIKVQLNKFMESKARIPIMYRSRWCDSISVPQITNFTWPLGSRGDTEKPRYITVGFQTYKIKNQKTNQALFIHANVKSVQAMLNSERYCNGLRCLIIWDYSLSVRGILIDINC